MTNIRGRTLLSADEGLTVELENNISGTNLKKGHCGSVSDSAIFDFRLLCQVVRATYFYLQSVYGEECSQIGRVRGNHYEGKKPPHPGHKTC